VNWQPVLRAFDPKLYDALRPYAVTDDALMPWAYQFANPQGRPFHNDWGIMTSNSFLKALQPFQQIRRMDCAYCVPLPFKLTSGKNNPTWMLWDTSYPTSPGTQIENRDIWDGVKTQNLPHALCDTAVEGSGRSTFAAFINGAWVECFEQYCVPLWGRYFKYYRGLKQDLTVCFDENLKPKSDLMAWFPEISTSWTK